MSNIEIMEEGKCVVTLEPRGDNGLEGYFMYSNVNYKKVRSLVTGEVYYCVKPATQNYHDSCSSKAFNTHFKIMEVSHVTSNTN